jgi:hypothetical protein
MVDHIDLWACSEGNQGIKRAKNILLYGWLAILGESPEEPLRYVKAHGMIPDLVQPLVDWVRPRRDARILSAVLSWVRLPDLWEGRLEDKTILEQIRVIDGSKLPHTAGQHIRQFLMFMYDFSYAYEHHPIVQAYDALIHLSDENVAFYRESRGPNGPLLEGCYKDIFSLREALCSFGTPLLDQIHRLQEMICFSADHAFRCNRSFSKAVLEYSMREGTVPSHSPCAGKLGLVSEKAGKIRIVASPDYWSQLSLRPIHDWLMGILRAFEPMDCTFDQKSAVPRIKEWQNEGEEVASFDQSSCTDLFPFDMQMQILKRRFDADSQLSEAYRAVMCDRDWLVTLPQSKTTKRVRWAVGQPMGLFSSWPLMAVAHHFLVQYCAWLANGRVFPDKPFDRYVICGDDIVISHPPTARMYIKVVKELGMKINMSKSHLSGGSTGVEPVSEFAKITVWKGIPLFPIKPKMVLSAIRDWRSCLPLLLDLTSRDGFHAKRKSIIGFVRRWLPRGARIVTSLMSVPLEFGGLGMRDSTSLRGSFDHLDAGQIHPWLLYLAEKIRAGLREEQRIANVVSEALVLEGYPKEVFDNHPLIDYAKLRWGRDYVIVPYRGAHNPELPSTTEIVRDLVSYGISPYDRYLIGHRQSNRFTSSEETKRPEMNWWMKAFTQRKVCQISEAPPQYLLARYRDSVMSRGRPDPFNGTPLDEVAQELERSGRYRRPLSPDEQIPLITSTMLAARLSLT